MSWVTASLRNGRWRVRAAARPSGAAVAAVDEAGQVVRTTAIISAEMVRVGDRLWQLELAKALHQNALTLAGAAHDFAAACTSGTAPLDWQVEPARRAARAVRIELARQGVPVAGVWRDRLAAACLFAVMAIAVGVAWLALLPTRFPLNNRPPGIGGVLFAVHAERSNRTRALLPPDFVPPEGSGYLILGRRAEGNPARLAGVLGLARLDRPPLLVRPGSVTAGLRSLPAAVAQLWRGGRAVAASAVLPPARELAAIIYRMLLGQCQARWWRDSGLRPDVVIYGHTGVADTTALELAQQAAGCRTVHLVHGVSAGWNFTGLSSLGVFACGHDARWHERLPGYGATAWLAEPPPPARPAGQGWVLLSNYIHPMNPRLAVDGPRQELELIDMVAGAAGRVAHRPTRLVWKPHPTFGSVAAGIREAVLERLRGRGFAVWPDGDGLDAMADFAAVLTTPSTVALDALRLGKVPVIVSTSPFQTDAAVGALPTRAEDEASLARLIDAVAAPGSYRSTFERCWASVQPGGRFTAEALARIVAMNPNEAVPSGSRTERVEA